MNNTAKELAKYIRKGNDANEDVILRAPSLQLPNPIYISNIPPYSKNIEDENALTFKNELSFQGIQFSVKSALHQLLFSFDGVNWSDIPKDSDGMIFNLDFGRKIMFKTEEETSFQEVGNSLRFSTSSTDYVTVRGKLLSLVSKKLVNTNRTEIEDAVFKSFKFRNFELISIDDKLSKSVMNLFDTCTFEAISTDSDCLDFTDFTGTPNNSFASNSIIVFLKNHNNFSAFFENITGNLGGSYTNVIKIYDTETPNILPFKRRNSDDFQQGMLDRNIGAKSIFDCGYFFEYESNHLKPWTLDELYNLVAFPRGEGSFTNSIDKNIIKHFLGPEYSFMDSHFDITSISIPNGCSYPIIANTNIRESINSKLIYTGILLSTYIIDSSGILNYGYKIALLPDGSDTSLFYDFSEQRQSSCEDYAFRTLRPIVETIPSVDNGSSAGVYDMVQQNIM